MATSPRRHAGAGRCPPSPGASGLLARNRGAGAVPRASQGAGPGRRCWPGQDRRWQVTGPGGSAAWAGRRPGRVGGLGGSGRAGEVPARRPGTSSRRCRQPCALAGGQGRWRTAPVAPGGLALAGVGPLFLGARPAFRPRLHVPAAQNPAQNHYLHPERGFCGASGRPAGVDLRSGLVGARDDGRWLDALGLGSPRPAGGVPPSGRR